MADDVTQGAREASAAAAAGSAPAAWATPGSRRKGAGSPWERFGWVMAAVWLVFLVYPVMALLRTDAASAWIVTGWVALCAFVVIYVAGFINGMRFGGGGLGEFRKLAQHLNLRSCHGGSGCVVGCAC